jgi:ATP-dependent RNA circularization protein (DNA/RNA ligase family)
MSESFHKFPHTPHLLWLGPGTPRDDKVLKPSEVADFLSGEVLVEEKIDGANLGISLGTDGRLRAQSRGNYLAPGKSHAQWKRLWPWLAERRAALEEGLRNGLMLFGEWCYARHTVRYNALPDWFLAFDLFEVHSGCFWSADRRNQWLHRCRITSVPEVARGHFQKDQILSFLGLSKIGHIPMEGIYLRRDSAEWLRGRAKVVSAVFKQQIEEHWTRRSIVPNHLVVIAPA